MEDWKDISELEIVRIAEKHNVDPKIIKGIVGEWYYYRYMADESYFRFEPGGFEISSLELAELSLFYHEHHALIESENHITTFEKVVFYPKKPDSLPLRLSPYFANTLIRTLFSDLKKKGLLLSENEARRVLSTPKKLGKQPEPSKAERNYLIVGAASTLRYEKIWRYSEIISELLSAMNIDEIKPGAIRRIVNRSQS